MVTVITTQLPTSMVRDWCTMTHIPWIYGTAMAVAMITSTSTLLNGGAQVYNENLIQWAASLYYDGATQINGTSGAETILGTMGDDVIFGDYGADTLWGGDGADTFVYTNTNQVIDHTMTTYRTLTKMKTA